MLNMPGSFPAIWDQTVTKFPEKRALSDARTELTYAQLNKEAMKLATWFQNRQIRGMCVLIRMDDQLDSIVAMLGILLSGNHYFYLSEEAYRKSGELLSFLELGAVIFDKEHSSPVTPEKTLYWKNLPQTISFSPAVVAEDDAFAIFTTSGSTGLPKLVCHSHRFIIDDTLAQISLMDIKPEDRRDYGGSLMFSASLGAIFPMLLSGAELFVHPLYGQDIFALPDLWARKRITITTVPVSVLRALAKSGDSLMQLRDMRLIIVTAEAASPDDMALFVRRLPGHILLANGYATTETRGICLVTFKPGEIENRDLGTVGIPVPKKQVYIEGKNGERLGAGHEGEVVVEAADLPRQYLNQTSSDPNPFELMSNGRVLFRTGDLGYFTPDGFLILKGRKDAIVKISGIKVNLQEIEGRIVSYPKVREAAVLLKENQRIHAFLAVEESFDLQDLKQFLHEKLPSSHLPSGWSFPSQLPKTLTGKTDRKNLAAQVVKSPREEPSFPEKDVPVLSAIQAIWKQELETDEDILPDHDFFKDLGGNSLLCAVCLHKLEERLDMSLPMGIGYTYTTPSSLANFITTHKNRNVLKIPVNAVIPGKPCLYLIPPYPGDRRTYHQLEGDLSAHYNLFFLYYNPLNADNTPVPFPALLDALVNEIDEQEEIHLLGFSFGGIVAYFMGILLEEKQKKLTRLILVDTPLYNQYTPLERACNFSVRVLRKLRQFIFSPQKLWKKYVLNFNTSFSEYRSNFTPEKFKDSPTHPSQVIWNYVQNFPRHKKINGEIILFRASEFGVGHQFKPDYSWHKFTPHPLETVLLNGWHEEIFTSPENIRLILETLTVFAKEKN